MKDGVRKYGSLIPNKDANNIAFISANNYSKSNSIIEKIAEYIPVSSIYSIDTFLK